MTTYDPRDCCDADAPLGYPRPNLPAGRSGSGAGTPDEDLGGALVWLVVALILGGLAAWWMIR